MSDFVCTQCTPHKADFLNSKPTTCSFIQPQVSMGPGGCRSLVSKDSPGCSSFLVPTLPYVLLFLQGCWSQTVVVNKTADYPSVLKTNALFLLPESRTLTWKPCAFSFTLNLRLSTHYPQGPRSSKTCASCPGIKNLHHNIYRFYKAKYTR